MTEKKPRDQKIDIVKGVLIIGMIFIHVVQFFYDYKLPINVFFNLVSFSGFSFAFGYSCYLAYFSKELKLVWRKMLSSILPYLEPRP